MDIYTIGHSTHTIEEFLSIILSYNVKTIVDVRSYPGSRYVPQFNKENMEKWLPENNVNYIHMKELGGRRKNQNEIDESLINGWTHESFRNYAGYTFTDEYKKGIDDLIELGKKEVVCYMCAESLPWRCHRLIISNTLVSKGITVHHIMSESKTILHELGNYGATPVIEGESIIYPKLD